MKLVPETIYKIVNDDGTEVRPATAQKIRDIVQILKDAEIMGQGSPVANTVAMRIASVMLSNYELRKRKRDSPQPLEQTDDGIPAFQDDDPDGLKMEISPNE